MSFLNDLGKKIGGAAEVAADKAKDLAEITKINYDISAVQKQMECDYAEIGKQVFALEKDDPESPVAELCAKIVNAQQTIDSLSARIAQIKAEGPQAAAPASAPASGKRFCPACGAEAVGDAKFCQSCGTPIK
jgi:flagellar hook-length control protein FliK